MGGWWPPWEGIGVDDSMRQSVLAAVRADLARLVGRPGRRGGARPGDRGRDGARRGAGDRGAAAGSGGGRPWDGQDGRRAAPAPAAGRRACEGYRAKQVQTVVGWITVRRAYYACAACGQGHCPLDADAGTGAGQPQSRRAPAGLPLRGAAALCRGGATILAAAARVHLSASTVRTVTEAVGARREAELAGEIAGGLEARAAARRLGRRRTGSTWRWTASASSAPMGPGARSRSGGGAGAAHTPAGERRERASYVAGLEPAAAFGQRAGAGGASARTGRGRHGRRARGWGGVDLGTGRRALLPGAVQIVDWFHASERVWELGRALFGAETAATTTWVEQQLGRLAQGQAATLAARVADAALSRGDRRQCATRR